MPKGFYKDSYGENEKASTKRKTIADNVPGPKKAAIVMVALGTKASSEIFKNLDEDEVELLTTEIARMENVSPELRDAVNLVADSPTEAEILEALDEISAGTTFEGAIEELFEALGLDYSEASDAVIQAVENLMDLAIASGMDDSLFFEMVQFAVENEGLTSLQQLVDAGIITDEQKVAIVAAYGAMKNIITTTADAVAAAAGRYCPVATRSRVRSRPRPIAGCWGQ